MREGERAKGREEREESVFKREGGIQKGGRETAETGVAPRVGHTCIWAFQIAELHSCMIGGLGSCGDLPHARADEMMPIGNIMRRPRCSTLYP